MQEFPRQLGIWTLICSISAAPSFVMALTDLDEPGQIGAMLLGICCFIVAYATLGSTSLAREWRRSPRVRRTVAIGYGTRIAISLLSACIFMGLPFPIFMDLYFGAVSLRIIDGLGFDNESPFGVFLTTLLQGGFLNIVLFIYMLVVYLILIPFVPSAPRAGACATCGYDLRASRDLCPECGTAIVTTTPT